MRLVSGDLLFELVDEPFERFHLHLSKFLVVAGFVLGGLVKLLQNPELLACIGHLSFASQVHWLTSIMPPMMPEEAFDESTILLRPDEALLATVQDITFSCSDAFGGRWATVPAARSG